MAILKIKNANGEFENVPAIIGAKGEQGTQGTVGANGKDGKDGLNGKDGINGKDGVDGKDGHTPVLGVDYWTENDKAEVQNYCNSYIDSQLGTINEQLASLTEVK